MVCWIIIGCYDAFIKLVNASYWSFSLITDESVTVKAVLLLFYDMMLAQVKQSDSFIKHCHHFDMGA